jgi:hypothetical protein
MGILSYLKKQKVKIEFSIMLTKLTSSFRQIVEIYKKLCLPKIYARIHLNAGSTLNNEVVQRMYDRGDFNDIINSAIEDELKTEIGLLVNAIFDYGVALSGVGINEKNESLIELHSLIIKPALKNRIEDSFRKMQVLRYDDKQLNKFVLFLAEFVSEQIKKI